MSLVAGAQTRIPGGQGQGLVSEDLFDRECERTHSGGGAERLRGEDLAFSLVLFAGLLDLLSTYHSKGLPNNPIHRPYCPVECGLE